jgi:hypothetical protein
MDPSSSTLQWIINFDLANYKVDLSEIFALYISKQLIPSKITTPDPFSGMSRCFDTDGYLIYEGYVKNNKRSGHGLEYSKQGTMLTYDGFFVNDKPTTRQRKIYNADGQIVFSGDCTPEQEPDCGVIYNHKSGKPLYAGSFLGAKFHGAQGYVFNADGKILCCGKWANGIP